MKIEDYITKQKRYIVKIIIYVDVKVKFVSIADSKLDQGCLGGELGGSSPSFNRKRVWGVGSAPSIIHMLE